MRRRGQAGQHHVAARPGLRRGGRPPRAASLQLDRRRTANVVHHQVVPGGEQVARHGAAHVPQADEPDFEGWRRPGREGGSAGWGRSDRRRGRGRGGGGRGGSGGRGGRGHAGAGEGHRSSSRETAQRATAASSICAPRPGADGTRNRPSPSMRTRAARKKSRRSTVHPGGSHGNSTQGPPPTPQTTCRLASRPRPLVQVCGVNQRPRSSAKLGDHPGARHPDRQHHVRLQHVQRVGVQRRQQFGNSPGHLPASHPDHRPQ